MTRYKNTRAILSISILGFELAFLICVKLLFGFIPGIELTTFFFAIFCLFLRIKEIFLLTISYLFLVSIIYGLGSWILAYWIVYPIDAVVIILSKKVIRNKIIFSSILFFLGFLFLPSYFIFDSLLYSKNIAIANSISSLPICLIGGFANLIAGLVLTPILIEHLNRNANSMYENYKQINFVKGGVISKFLAVVMIVSSFVGIGGFYYNFVYFQEMAALFNREHRYQYKKGLLTPKDYNRIKNSLKSNQIAIIGEYNSYTFQVTVNLTYSGETLGHILFNRFNEKTPFLDKYNPCDNKYFKPPQFYFKIGASSAVYGRLVGMLEYRLNNNDFINVSPYKKLASIYTTDFSNLGADSMHFKNNCKEVVQIYY